MELPAANVTVLLRIVAGRGDNLLALYSTVTRLAYVINQEFYRGIHYVWCAPAPSQDASVLRNPDSSDPWWLFEQLARDIKKGELHSAIVDRNRSGLIRGAESRHAQGIIDEGQRLLIQAMVEEAVLIDFEPLFMVIPYSGVKDRNLVSSPSFRDRARATSHEFIIENLPRCDFDVWSSPR